MATKDLARTVIEGGRYHGNCWDRRNSNARLRAMERDFARGLRRGGDFDALVIPRRECVRRWFRDKLGPTERWLRSNVGRPWDLVRSELFRRFDTRTTPGRHIVFCHMLPSVHDHSGIARGWIEFIVDEQGILRQLAPWKGPARRRLEPLPPGIDPCGWLAGRRVGARGEVLFWFTPTPAGAFRQSGRLSARECVYWRALPAWFRERHVPAAPIVPKEIWPCHTRP